MHRRQFMTGIGVALGTAAGTSTAMSYDETVSSGNSYRMREHAELWNAIQPQRQDSSSPTRRRNKETKTH